MSLADLTRNCFQSGIPATKWISLCQLYLSKDHTAAVHDLSDIERSLSNSVLVLYRSYPGDPDLQDYFKCAIQGGLISLPVFVATLLQAARSPELHTPATLDMLCRVALDAHYSSGLPPIGSVVSYGESPIVVLGIIRDALALLRTAHSLPMSHFHQLTTSASELIILLLSCVTDMSQVSTAQAMVHFSDANDILQTVNPLSDDVRQVLQTFVVSLSLLIGDDAKVAREAQMMQTIQLALGKGDLLGPGSDTDIVTLSLILHHLVRYRAKAFGSGSSFDPVVLLLGALRCTSWTPAVFYTQLLLSAFMCLSQSSFGKGGGSVLLWRAFIIGRLPRILVMFEKVVNSENANDADWRAAMQVALTSVLRLSDLVSQCNRVLSSQPSSPQGYENVENPRLFTRGVLQQFLATGLIDRTSAIAMDPMISNDNTFRLQFEALEAGCDLESYLDSKLTLDTNVENVYNLIERVIGDPGSHADFAEVLRKRFATLTSGLDLESFHHLCRLLYLNDTALDIVSLHIKISDLIFYALSFLEEYECETVGDPQTAVSHLGDVVLFLQSTISRFHLSQDFFSVGDKRLSATFLRTTTVVHSVEDLSGEDAVAFGIWFKALFDYNSDGIEDTIFRSTPPRTLLRISATLFSHAILAYSENKITVDVLTNGVAYFTSSLLNWTLVGVVRALLKEIETRNFSAPTHMDILQTLLLSHECPRSVLCLCSPSILKLLNDRGGQDTVKFDVSIRQATIRALGINGEPHSTASPTAWMDQPRIAIRDSLASARAANAVSLDVDYCILVSSPAKFLFLLWSELSIAASQGEMETCRRIATFALTIPRSSGAPLLPVFLHIVVPSLISTIDRQKPPEQTMNTELLVTVISSALTSSLHLEWALHSITGETGHVLGQSTAAMTRRFAGALHQRSLTGQAIVQRLTSSPSFVANFPTFVSELV